MKKKEHYAMLQFQKEEHQKELLTNQIEIQNQTMQYIGREIHDNVGQKLTLASLYTQQLAFENKAPHINENIENISKIINDSLSELRELSKSLTSDSIRESNLVDLISLECSGVNKTKKCKVEFDYEQNFTTLNYEQKSILLRICQEFIQNSLKYSNCKLIHIRLMRVDQSIEFELKDDGIGFDINQDSKGIGLENIKKRTILLNGTFELSSNLNQGTRLFITIPLV